MIKTVLRTLLLMVFCVVLGVACAYAYKAFFADESRDTTIDLTVLEERLADNKELSTAKYLYTATATITDQNDLSVIGHPEIKMPFSDATYVLQFDGTIKAGFDLTAVEPEVRNGNTVVVKLPAPKILSHETGNVETKLDQQNILNPLKAGEESQWLADKKAEMEDRAVGLGLYDEAKQSAKVVFESLYAGCLPDGAMIEVEFSES